MTSGFVLVEIIHLKYETPKYGNIWSVDEELGRVVVRGGFEKKIKIPVSMPLRDNGDMVLDMYV